jgi:hypothetical protein
VRFVVGFVPNVKAIPVCQSIKGRLVWIVTRPNQIKIVLSAKKEWRDAGEAKSLSTVCRDIARQANVLQKADILTHLV